MSDAAHDLSFVLAVTRAPSARVTRSRALRERFCLLSFRTVDRYGGLYADLDLHPVDTIDAMLRGQTLLLPHTPNIGLTNAMIAATARHPFITFAMHELINYRRGGIHLSKHFTVLTSTGSTFIWAMHMRWSRTHSLEESARLVPAADWGKCSYCESAIAARPRMVRRPVSNATAAALQPVHGAVINGAVVGDKLATVADSSAKLVLQQPLSAVGGDASVGAQPLPRSVRSLLPTHRAWRSPFAHGEGSSWHSDDSFLVLLLFCHADIAAILVLALCICFRWHSLRRIAIEAAALLFVIGMQKYTGCLIFETFIGRPFIWLSMT